MKSLLGRVILVAFMLICFGCAASTSNISRVEEKWGPPAEVEQKDDSTIYYYYFQSKCVEITCDKGGNIIKKRQYWVQPR